MTRGSPGVRRRLLGRVLLLALLAAGCPGKNSGEGGLGAVLTATTERDLRSALGIPAEAPSVLILSQTAHWDIDWLFTFDTYFARYVEPAIREALDLLQTDPAFYYSVSEIAYVRRYWDLHPEDHARMRSFARSGRLRVVGGGTTSPDTLLPGGEALLRDWQRGSRWAEQNLGVLPRTAWQPDSFGHTPDLPALLASLGMDAVGFARIDGGATLAGALSDAPPYAKGSNAQFLAVVTKSADFVWEASDGSQVLAHWMPFSLYCEGDTIDGTAFPIYGLHFDTPATEGVTNAAITRYAGDLAPLSRTGYMFVPVGCDFQLPKRYLTQYARNWNRDVYPSTGTFVVVATFDDYVRFVDFHRQAIPVLQVDPNPYFMGYYASRQDLKRLSEETEAALLDAERLWAIAERGGASTPVADLGGAWDLFLPSNHHDWVTGTAVDPVYKGEQLPVLDQGLAQAQGLRDAAAQALAARVSLPFAGDAAAVVVNPSGFSRSELVRASVSFAHGGAASVRVAPAEGGDPVPSQVTPRAIWADGTLAQADVDFVAGGVPPVGFRTFLLDGVSTPAAPPADAVALSPNGRGIDLVGGGCTASTNDADGTIDRFVCGGQVLLGPGSNDLVFYQDDGGLYRLGHEMNRCGFRAVTSPLGTPLREIVEQGPLRATVRYTATGSSGAVTREYSVEIDQPRLRMTTTLAAPEGYTVAARFETPLPESLGLFSIPHGMVARPPVKIFNPTFWPAMAWVALLTPAGVGDLFLSPTNRSWSYDGVSKAETVLARDARQEQCGTLGAGGADDATHTLVYAVEPLGPSWAGLDPPPRRGTLLADPLVVVPIASTVRTAALPPVDSLVSYTASGTPCPACPFVAGSDPCRLAFCPGANPDASRWLDLVALKDADDGGGLLARWVNPAGGGGTLTLSGPLSGRSRRRTDAREHLGGAIEAGAIPLERSITDVWIAPQP